MRQISHKATNHSPTTSSLGISEYFGLGEALIQPLEMFSASDTRFLSNTRLLSDTRLPIMTAALGNAQLNRASTTSPSRSKSISLNLDTAPILQHHTKTAHT
jgi:hypothetical protein